MVRTLEEYGVPVKYHHSENGGPGQVEIEVEFATLKEMADRTLKLKCLLKNIAIQNGKTVTFMPKPFYGECGSGMHVHLQMFNGGKPVFYDENGYSNLSKTALAAISGILEHAAALTAFACPSTNSYKRLVPGYEAPVTIGFATSNRSSVIRIPAYAKSPETKRFELRCPDGTCNPYYAFAAVLMAGIDGIKNRIDPVKEGYGPYDFNLYHLSEKDKKKIKALPKSLDESLDALEADHAFLTEGGVFTERLIEVWLAFKRAELARYNQFPAPIEFELYYHL
jgi:glutamine synthetase